MKNTRVLVLGALLSGLAVVFQLLPVFFSEAVIVLTILSTIPIFIIARTAPKIGIIAYAVTSIVIVFVSIHEGLMYMCTNGLIGVVLGVCLYNTRNRLLACAITSTALMLALSFLYNFVGIPVLGVALPGFLPIQLLVLFVFGMLYTALLLRLMEYLMKRLNI